MDLLLAIGCDGARGGWVAVECYGESPESQSCRTRLSLAGSIADIAAMRLDGTVVGMDVPMGLLESVDLRDCDREAQQLLGQRWMSVFQPPSRPILQAPDYAEARALVAKLRETSPKAKSISAQAFGLVPKVKEIDDWLIANPGAQDWLYEVHPELSFRAMRGQPIDEAKNGWPGQQVRMALIEQAFPDARTVIASAPFTARQAQLQDILDAYAVAWSTLRVVAGEHDQIGRQRDRHGLIMRMVF